MRDRPLPCLVYVSSSYHFLCPYIRPVGARTLRITSANVTKDRPRHARTLRIASANVEKSPPNGARTLRIASTSVEKSPPNGARTLRIASASVENSHPSGARTSPTCCLNDASRHGSAPARYALQRRQSIYGRASAPPSCGARARRRKTVSFLGLENGPCFGRQACVTLGSSSSEQLQHASYDTGLIAR